MTSLAERHQVVCGVRSAFSQRQYVINDGRWLNAPC
jgi:hypothetical protein